MWTVSMREYGIINLHKDLLFKGATYEVAPDFYTSNPIFKKSLGADPRKHKL